LRKLFTERHGESQPRVKEELDSDAMKGVLALIMNGIEQNLFAKEFSEECPDGGNSIGCNERKLREALAAYDVISPWDWPKREEFNDNDIFPEQDQLFDLVEFMYEHAALAKAFSYHDFFRHDHFDYDQKEGRAKFATDINRLFERRGLAFELVNGEVTRIAPTGLHEALASTIFRTGDAQLDALLETAREKFLNKALNVRKEGLEKLWDAWERIKTIEPGKDKRAQASAILDKASTEPHLRDRLNKEALELTEIGNQFMIRHTETNKTPITESAHVDYLFQRMFAMLRLLLKTSGRGG